MPGAQNDDDEKDGKSFPITSKSLKSRLVRAEESVRNAAFGDFCKIYWEPLFVFARRLGLSKEDAEDVTQGFLEVAMKKETMAKFDRNRGKLRNFVLSCFRNHIYRWFEKRNTIKQGGRVEKVSLEDALELPDGSNTAAEMAYDEKWAVELADQVMEFLERDAEKREKLERFRALSPFLLSEVKSGEVKQLAEQMGESSGALSTELHRLRSRFRDKFCQSVAITVAAAPDVRPEATYLAGLLGMDLQSR